MRFSYRFLVLLLPCFLLAGCFIVKDFGAYWDKGVIDPNLEGAWTDISSRKNMILVKRGDHYGYANLNETTRVKTLKLGDATYLMFWGNAAKGLLRYVGTEDRMIVYSPNPTRKADFINHHLNNSKNFTITHKGVGIEMLDEHTVSLLEKLAKDDSYWVEQMILEKGHQLTDEELQAQALEEAEAADVPDPFAEKREEFKDVIGKKKGTDEDGQEKPTISELPAINPFIELIKRSKEQTGQTP